MSAPDRPLPRISDRLVRRWGVVFACFWLVFLINPVSEALRRGTPQADAGAVLLISFAGVYVVAASAMRALIRTPPGGNRKVLQHRLIIALAVMVVLAAASYLLVGELALATAPFLAVVGPLGFGRWGIGMVAATAAAVAIMSRVSGLSWSDSTGYITGTLSAGLSVWAFVLFMQTQAEKVRASEAEASLAVETERGRFARDLHDIVGHTLSVVTLKAGLARRLLEVDPDRAAVELAELEALAREALDDVRRAVGGYREISLPGELARARELLESAGILAEVPTAADDVRPELRELFAWTVREGVTNVVRHSGARRCRIILSRDALSVEDDGVGGAPAPRRSPDAVGGHGLTGLRERASQAGAIVIVESLDPGFRLTTEGKSR